MAPSLSPSALKKRRQRARRSSERKEEAKKVDRERKQLKSGRMNHQKSLMNKDKPIQRECG